MVLKTYLLPGFWECVGGRETALFFITSLKTPMIQTPDYCLHFQASVAEIRENPEIVEIVENPRKLLKT